ncbi:DUF4437 domain-containing protein [Sphingosinicella sp.]|uniref:DUF4437 domain-containing protein n=1 Tax=Sphingosinicella sp. TaxID=1917971 RepID=UPI004037B2ED
MSAGLLAVLLAAGAPMVVVPGGEARFAPIDPARPDGAAIAVLRGDPAAGPSDMLLRIGRGEGRLHVHSADYRLVVPSGTMRHRAADQAGETADLGPGSYWFQPGGVAHADSCLSEQCVMFISWTGPRDARLAEGESR